MNEITDKEIDLKALEKKVYRSFFEDGFWDIFVGMLILGFSFSWTRILFELFEPLDLMIMILIWNTISVLIFFLGKKFVTAPRMGIVKFGEKRKARQKRLKIFLLVNVLFGVTVFVLTFFGLFEFLAIAGSLIPLLIGLLSFTIPFSIVAYFLGFNRLYIYSLMAGFSFFVSEIISQILGSPLDSIIGFGVPGGIIVIIGIVYLLKFLHKYPKPERNRITE
jgi:MFS family permease